MEYNKKNKEYSDRAQRAEACCKIDDSVYDNMKVRGPDGYWGIHPHN